MHLVPRPHRAVTHRLVTLALALSLLLVPAGAASAQPSWNGGYREKVDLAGGVWLTETEHSFTDVTVRAFDVTEQVLPGRPSAYQGNVVVFAWHVERDPDTGAVTETDYEGFGWLPGSTFSFSRNLASAAAHGSMLLHGSTCTYPPGGGGPPDGLTPLERFGPLDEDEAECTDLGYTTVDVDLTWVGQGPVYRDASRLQEAEPPSWRFHAHTVTGLRDAVLTGSISGDGLHLAAGPATFGLLLRGAHVERLLVR